MSYILEALKKSEQERGHGTAPGIQTMHSSSLNYHREKRSRWPWILVVAVMLNFAALLYFIFHRQAPAPLIEVDKVSATSTSPPAANVHRETFTQTHTMVATPPASVEPEPTPAAKVEPRPVESVPASFRAVDISELPAEIRQQIPAMDFSAHVYSSNPQQRSVVINGRFMEEGEKLNDDFVLTEITSTGVIMDFRGYLFSTTVITGW